MNFVGHQQILLQRWDLSWRTAFLQCSPVVVRFDQDPSPSFGMTNRLGVISSGARKLS
jgi:hypothetical protein